MSQYGEREATQCKPLKKALSAWVWSRDTCLSHLFHIRHMDEPASDALRIAYSGIFSGRIKQYNNQWTVLERCLHHHTSAGLINEAGFLYANLPRIASRQRVGIMVGQCFAASKYAMFPIRLERANQWISICSAHHSGQIARARNVTACQARGIGKIGVSHAECARLSIHRGDKGRAAAWIIAR